MVSSGYSCYFHQVRLQNANIRVYENVFISDRRFLCNKSKIKCLNFFFKYLIFQPELYYIILVDRSVSKLLFILFFRLGCIILFSWTKVYHNYSVSYFSAWVVLYYTHGPKCLKNILYLIFQAGLYYIILMDWSVSKLFFILFFRMGCTILFSWTKVSQNYSLSYFSAWLYYIILMDWSDSKLFFILLFRLGCTVLYSWTEVSRNYSLSYFSAWLYYIILMDWSDSKLFFILFFRLNCNL